VSLTLLLLLWCFQLQYLADHDVGDAALSKRLVGIGINLAGCEFLRSRIDGRVAALASMQSVVTISIRCMGFPSRV
jgi:hypothetical protein